MSTSHETKPKKRHRIPVSCLACRKRKAKCDRGRPHCANCVGKNLTHLCHYEESPWFSQGQSLELEEEEELDAIEDSEIYTHEKQELLALRRKVEMLESSLASIELGSRQSPASSEESRFRSPPAYAHSPHHSGPEHLDHPAPPRPLSQGPSGASNHSSSASGVHTRGAASGYPPASFVYPSGYSHPSPHQPPYSSVPRPLPSYPPAAHGPSTPPYPASIPHTAGNQTLALSPLAVSPGPLMPSGTLSRSATSSHSSKRLRPPGNPSVKPSAFSQTQPPSLAPTFDIPSIRSPEFYQDLINVDDTDTMSDFQDYETAQFGPQFVTNTSPLSYIGVSTRDPHLRLFGRAVSAFLPEEEEANAPEVDMEKSLLQSRLHAKTERSSSLSSKNSLPLGGKDRWSSNAPMVDSSSNADSDNSNSSSRKKEHLTQLLIQTLPSKRAVHLLLERFFTYVYPFSPVVHREPFYADLHRIFGPSFTDISEVSSSHLDFAEETVGCVEIEILGVLCVVMFMAHAFLLDEEEATRDADEAYLLSGSEVLENGELLGVAVKCLAYSRFTRRETTLMSFQLAYLIRVAGHFGFKEKYSSYSSVAQAENCTLVQLAYNMTLHRDPESKFHQGFKTVMTPETIQLRRKLWYSVLDLDCAAASNATTSMIIYSHNLYDTKVPCLKTDAIETSINERFEMSYRFSLLYNELSSLMTNTREAPTVSQVVTITNKFSALTKSIVGDDGISIFRPFSTTKESHRKVNILGYGLRINSIVMILEYYIFLHYEKRGAGVLSAYMMKKLCFSGMKCLKLARLSLLDGTQYFGKGFRCVVKKGCFHEMLRGQTALMGLLLRCLHYQRYGEEEKDRPAKMVLAEAMYKRFSYYNTRYRNLSRMIHENIGDRFLPQGSQDVIILLLDKLHAGATDATRDEEFTAKGVSFSDSRAEANYMSSIPLNELQEVYVLTSDNFNEEEALAAGANVE